MSVRVSLNDFNGKPGDRIKAIIAITKKMLAKLVKLAKFPVL
jgi:hypothetical protein